jgi:large subunit ribosomal protein L21
MFAVIKTGGKQYRVAEDQMLQIEKIDGEPGKIVQIGNVLMIGGEQPQFGSPSIDGASVAVEVIEQGRGPKVIAFKKRRRKNSRRRRGHRQAFTLIRISEILTGGAAPTKAAKGATERRPQVTAKASGADEAAESDTKPKARAKGRAKSSAKPKASAKPKGKKK